MTYPTVHNTSKPVEPGRFYYAVTQHTIGHGQVTELGYGDDGEMAIEWNNDGLHAVDHPIHFHDTFESALAHWNQLREVTE